MTIPCCLCGVPIEPDNSNMCKQCLRSEVDITEGIEKEGLLYQCRKCQRFRRGNGWVDCGLESKELIAICLKSMTGLRKVKLIDANFIWTEPHSKRIKVKITIQKEALNHNIVQQSCIITFIVRNEQCKDCNKQFFNSTWKSVVQVRQKTDHKRTFLYLEQMILKHDAHIHASSIERSRDGMDFFFNAKNQAETFCHFVSTYVPTRINSASQLVSTNTHNNTANIKWTFIIEIAPICRDDVVILPLKVAQQFGNISMITLVTKITNQIHIIDPFTGKRAAIPQDKYWRASLSSLLTSKFLIDFTVLDIDYGNSSFRNSNSSIIDSICEVQVARNTDFGVNDQTFHVVTHLGNLLNVGDIVQGYDLTTCNFSADALSSFHDRQLPDILLVRKNYPRRHKHKEKLKSLTKNDDKRKDREKSHINAESDEDLINDLLLDDEINDQ